MFITKADLNQSIYPEIAQAITRYGDSIVEAKFATAESEIESYLCQRYLIRPELEKVGADRNSLLVSIALDLAIYHLYTNPEKMPEVRVKRYEQGIEMLKLAAKGVIKLPGVPAAPEDVVGPSGTGIGFGSQPPRSTGW